MPGGDGTGPGGMGPMTGRGAGYCAGYGVPGYMNPVGGRGFWGGGRGFGGGFGGGRGRRNQFYATGLTGWQRAGMGYPAYGAGVAPQMSKQQEVDALKGQAEYLEGALNDIRERLDALQKDAEK